MADKRMRRFVVFVILVLAISFFSAWSSRDTRQSGWTRADQPSAGDSEPRSPKAIDELGKLAVKGRSPKTGYSRLEFGEGWAKNNGCDTRNKVLQRDLSDKRLADDGCIVLNGVLEDPYTGKRIEFMRGSITSSAVQIDHVVALSDAWQKGAQFISLESRINLANDALNLLAVDGPTNMKKSDGDAATWLPSNKAFRCQYVARQIAVKVKYTLWVTLPERGAMEKVLKNCPDQLVPIVK